MTVLDLIRLNKNKFNSYKDFTVVYDAYGVWIAWSGNVSVEADSRREILERIDILCGD